jgi:hypothetical protein
MRRQAFHGKPPGHPNPPRFLIRPVVEQLGLGMPGDRHIDFLAGHPFRNVGVASDRLQLDVRHALVDEPLTYVVMGSFYRRTLSSTRRLPEPSFARISENVVGKPRPHDPLPRKRERHSRGINCDPPPPPLLGDKGTRPRPTGRIKHEITRVRGHEHAPLNSGGCSLHHVDLWIRSALYSPDVHPRIGNWERWKVIMIPNISQSISSRLNSPCQN